MVSFFPCCAGDDTFHCEAEENLKLSIFSVMHAPTINFSCLDFYQGVKYKKLLLIIVQIHCSFLSWYRDGAPSICICMVWLELGSVTAA